MCFVAVCDDKVIGFVDAGSSREPSLGKGEIYAIYLLNHYKCQGIGRALWMAAVDYLSGHELAPFIVWGLKENLVALKFYEKHGGVLMGTKDSEIGGKLYLEVSYQFS
jgi:ribosomal protein S18 acetylase RimI-like enzyme